MKRRKYRNQKTIKGVLRVFSLIRTEADRRGIKDGVKQIDELTQIVRAARNYSEIDMKKVGDMIPRFENIFDTTFARGPQ